MCNYEAGLSDPSPSPDSPPHHFRGGGAEWNGPHQVKLVSLGAGRFYWAGDHF